MEKHILNYRVVIEQEKIGRKNVYNAFCPTLGIADYGDTIDEALKRLTSLMQFHIECLIEEGHEVPIEKNAPTIIASIEIPNLPQAKFSYV